jgi:signal transduction histidine kinase
MLGSQANVRWPNLRWGGEVVEEGFKTREQLEQELNEFRANNQALETQLAERLSEHAGVHERLQIELDERKQLEARLLAAERFASAAKVMGTLAHDLTNLLTIIRGYSELMQGHLPTDDFVVQTEVAEVMKAVDRAAALVNRVLTMQLSTGLDFEIGKAK